MGTAVAGVAAFLSQPRLLFAQEPARRKELPRPVILPTPIVTKGVRSNVVVLNGIWKLSANAAPDFWKAGAPSTGVWADVLVPGQADRQGLPIQRTKPYAYRHAFAIPLDFAESRIFLRFEGVSGTARFWINGVALEEHRGGYTIFTREITTLVKPGQNAELAVGITDPNWNDWPSGFDAGGILRSVKLVAVPSNCITRLHAETDFDPFYTDATLHIDLEASLTSPEWTTVTFQLAAPDGTETILCAAPLALTADKRRIQLSVPCKAPQKWDAEHPNLYVLTATLMMNGHAVTSVERRIGFRKIEICGRRILVNGSEIKLRGGGRFDSDPHLGHTLTPAQCVEEVRLFKAANLNYIRPACFPAMEEYLDACDRLGMYVEGETSVTFTHGPEQMSSLAPVFVGQVAEMLEVNRSHPSILFWSIGNESNYGENIRREFDYVQTSDPTRPILFSWSHGIPEGKPLPYNLYSYHYPDIDVDMGKPGVAAFNGDGKLWRDIPEMPVLHDEFAHLACYDRSELRRDPNVRNFWGEGIRQFWHKMYLADGCMGGAVWALVDEPDAGNKVYSWGILDLYRRKRPEYWLLRKAYSPVRVGSLKLGGTLARPLLTLSIANWFNHSNLNEVRISWKIGKQSGSFFGPDLGPRGHAMITIPGEGLQSSKVLEISFTHNGLQVEEARFVLESQTAPVAVTREVSKREESASLLKVTHGEQTLVFDKAAGQLTASVKGVALLLSSPRFHMLGAELPAWTSGPMRTEGDAITFSGAYGNKVQVRFSLSFEADGWMQMSYSLDKFTVDTPLARIKPWNDTDKGGFEEVGFCWVLPNTTDLLAWKRRALYSVYPDDHIGRPEGFARRSSGAPLRAYGETPKVSYSLDEQDFDLYGPDDRGGRGTNDFRSSKEYIFQARAESTALKAGVELDSNGKHAIRLEVANGGIRMLILDEWNYNHLGNGNYMRPPIHLAAGHTSSVRFRLIST